MIPALESISSKIEQQLGSERLGLIYALFYSICYFSIQLYTKLRKKYIDYSTVSAIRFFVLFLLNYMCANYYKKPLDCGKKNWWFLLMRNFLGMQITLVLFYAVTKIPMSYVQIVFILNPLITTLLSQFITRERYSLHEILLTIFSTIGVLIIIKPEWFGGDFNESKNSSTDYLTGTQRTVIQIMILISVVGMTIANLLIKRIPEIHLLTMNQQFSFIGIVFSVFIQILNQHNTLSSFYYYIQAILVVGIIGFMSQTLYALAYQKGKSGQVAIFSLTNIIYSYAYEILFMGQIPDGLTILGAIIVFFSVLITLLRKN